MRLIKKLFSVMLALGVLMGTLPDATVSAETEVGKVEIELPAPRVGESYTTKHDTNCAGASVDEGAGYYIKTAHWTESRTLNNGGEFAYGNDYYAEIELYPSPGYTFAENVSVSVNGSAAESVKRLGNILQVKSSPVKPDGNPVGTVTMTVSLPTPSDSAPHATVQAHDDTYTINYANWYDEDGIAAGSYESGSRYFAEISISPVANNVFTKGTAIYLKGGVSMKSAHIESDGSMLIVTENITVKEPAPTVLNFSEGKKMSYNKAQDKKITLNCPNTDVEHFKAIRLDGHGMADTYYDLTGDPVSVTIYPGAFKRLSDGDHTLELVSSYNGEEIKASLVLTVSDEKPQVKTTEVYFKVEDTQGDPLSPCAFQIRDENDYVVEKLNYEGKTVVGRDVLENGKTYTIHVIRVPDNYRIPADGTVSINSSGIVTSTYDINKNGVIVIRAAEANPKGTASDKSKSTDSKSNTSNTSKSSSKSASSSRSSGTTSSSANRNAGQNTKTENKNINAKDESAVETEEAELETLEKEEGTIEKSEEDGGPVESAAEETEKAVPEAEEEEEDTAEAAEEEAAEETQETESADKPLTTGQKSSEKKSGDSSLPYVIAAGVVALGAGVSVAAIIINKKKKKAN